MMWGIQIIDPLLSGLLGGYHALGEEAARPAARGFHIFRPRRSTLRFSRPGPQ